MKFESACVLRFAVRTCGVMPDMLHYFVGCFHGFMCMETSLIISTSCFRGTLKGLGAREGLACVLYSFAKLHVLFVLAVLVVLWAHRPRAAFVGLLVVLLAGLLAPCWLCWLCLGRIGLGRLWCVCWLACWLACWPACSFLRRLSRSA